MKKIEFVDINEPDMSNLTPKQKKEVFKLKGMVQKCFKENIQHIEKIKNNINKIVAGNPKKELTEKEAKFNTAVMQSTYITTSMNLLHPMIIAMKEAGFGSEEIECIAEDIKKMVINLFEFVKIINEEDENLVRQYTG